MEITKKSIRKAQIALIKQAETIAAEKKISFHDAVLSIIETPSDSEMVVRAFSKVPVTSGHKQPVKQEIPDY